MQFLFGQATVGVLLSSYSMSLAWAGVPKTTFSRLNSSRLGDIRAFSHTRPGKFNTDAGSRGLRKFELLGTQW